MSTDPRDDDLAATPGRSAVGRYAPLPGRVLLTWAFLVNGATEILFLIPTRLTFHTFRAAGSASQIQQLDNFLKNVALMGLAPVMAFGPGPVRNERGRPWLAEAGAATRQGGGNEP